MAVVNVLAAATAWSSPVTAPVLDVHGATLTSYKPTAATAVQGLRPRFDQRGVDIDGTLRALAPLGWTVHADPLGGGYASGRTLGDVNLFTGSYHPTEVDLALPTLGLPVVIGRTFNGVQRDSGNALMNSDGYQGWNWAQMAQPEIVYFAAEDSDDDMIYLVYGADRFVEFKRTGLFHLTFKSKNGAAGVIVQNINYDLGDPTQTCTYYDQRGNAITFFAPWDTAGSGAAAGQMWKMSDSAGNTAYVESTNKATAVANGYDAAGRMNTLIDGSGRKYFFTYTDIGTTPKKRLTKVEAKTKTSGAWDDTPGGVAVVAKVEYDYYTSTDPENDMGLEGDLRLVTITMPTDSGDYIRKKYYRYYTRAWADSAGRRGNAHALKMVVGFDGVRQYDFTTSTLDAASESTLKPYSDLFLEYTSSTDERIWKVTFNGNCGCGGGSSGLYTLTYDDSSGYAAGITGTTYTGGYGKRTVILQPDGKYVTQYFDEVGQVLGRVLTAGDPSSSPGNTWATNVIRNSAGQVTEIRSPANADAYTHTGGSAGSITQLSTGLITLYGRHSNSDNLDGLRETVSVQNGTGGSPILVSGVTLQTAAERQLIVGSSGVTLPEITESKTYPTAGGTALTTAIASTYWSGTDTNPQYIARKKITTTNPMVTTGNHGSNASTTTAACLRADGSMAFSVDATGIIFYSGRNGFGQTQKTIADCNTGGSFLSGDTPSDWSISTSGTPIAATTDYTYDAQGRLLTVIQPAVGTGSGGSTRTSAMKYGVEDGLLYTMSSPRLSGGNYHGSISFSQVNHAGKPVKQAIIKVATPSGSFPSSTQSSSTWSALVGSFYDSSGMRLTETRTYTDISGASPHTYDSATYGYDAMGRRERIKDATGTITRSVFDDRGMVAERWVGSNDNGLSGGSGSGTNDMTKVEAMVYDGGSAGGNGHMTGRTQDADGNWGGSADQRTTTIAYDFRGRAGLVTNPTAPHTLTKYDNMNRAVAVGQYSSIGSMTVATDPTTTASNRLALSETSFDQRGQVYQAVRWEINQSSGAKGSGLYVDNWYDANGRMAKMVGSQIVKTTYDRLGRALGRYVLAELDDSTYAHALLVSGNDTVLEESHTVYDAPSGRPLMQYTVQRAHDDDLASVSGTAGMLDPAADAGLLEVDPAAIAGRVQISAMWYDAWDRVTDTVNVGTNDGIAFDRADAIASRGDGYLRTTQTYDDFGRGHQTFDVNNVQNRTEYDFAGRRIKTTDNYVDGTVGGGANNDEDRIMEYGYSTGRLTTVTRKMPGSGNDQTTTYTYGTVNGADGSQISDNRLLLKTVLPEQVTSQAEADRRTLSGYNALGEVIKTTDPAGNIIDTSYDASGRVTERLVSTFGSGFDTRVKKVQYAYTGRGQLETVTQKNASNVTLDSIAFTYTGLGHVLSTTQDPIARDEFVTVAGYQLVGPSGHKRLVAPADWRLESHIAQVTYDITGNAIDAAIGRISSVIDQETSATIAQYAYLGAGTVVGVELPEPWVYSRSYATGKSELGGAAYEDHLDQFNRPTTNTWVKDLGGSPLDPTFVDLSMQWSRNGQLLTVQDAVLKDAGGDPNFDQDNQYDALRRLGSRAEGELGGATVRFQNLVRDLAGRTTTDQMDLNNNSVFTDGPPNAIDGGELNDDRVFNKRNELRSRTVYDYDNPSTPRSVTLDYDKNGNLTDDGEKYKYVYNPFGQLVKITDQSNAAQAVYTYNGLGQRISEQLDSNDSSDTGTPDGAVTAKDPVFYMALDQQGRRVATYRGSDTYAKEAFIWHPAGLGGPTFKGGLLLRDRNDSLVDPTQWALEEGQETRAERMYACSDFRGDVVALVRLSESGGVLAEQYRYSATGIPIGIPLGDLNADGLVDYGGAEEIVLKDAFSPNYQVRADLNLDGVVDSTDEGIVVANDGVQTGRGLLSAPAVGSRVGYRNMEVFGSGFGVVWAKADREMMHSGLGRPLQAQLTKLPRKSNRHPSSELSILGTVGLYAIRETQRDIFAAESIVGLHPRVAQFQISSLMTTQDPDMGDQGPTWWLLLGNLGCILDAYNRASEANGVDDKYRHCLATCLIARSCRFDAAIALGILKEFFDMGYGWWNNIPGDMFEDSRKDMIANHSCVPWESVVFGQIGGWIGNIFRESCDTCCRRKTNQQQ